MNAISEKRVFQVDFGGRRLTGDIMSNRSAPRVLVLHGAGNAHRGDFRLFREEFLIHGISSIAFDFVGHGDTGGELKNSSLISRTRQACRVVDSVNMQQPFSVIAASMGAYTAVSATRFNSIDTTRIVAQETIGAPLPAQSLRAGIRTTRSVSYAPGIRPL